MSALSLLRGQLKWFEQNGWNVILVSTPDLQALQAAKRENVTLAGVPMDRSIAPIKDIRALIQWIKILQKYRPDAVNVGTPKAALLGTIAAWLLRIPKRVYLVRGLRVEGTSGVLRWTLSTMERITMYCATDVVFVSKSLAAEAAKRKLLARKKSWTVGAGSSNGVDSEAIESRLASIDRNELRSELGFKSTDLVVGFVGRISSDKGVKTLLDALQDSKLEENIHGLLIGAVEDESLAKEADGLGSRCKRIPWTDDVWGYLPAMDILCLPTLREGFPNVVLEASAAGVPVITTRATGAVDSVVPEKTGYLIDIGDSEELVRRLNALNADRSRLQQMGNAARKRTVEEFHPERIWEGFAEIIAGKENPSRADRVCL
ncbi:glycosyltransferase family 4 protein [Corynebacterium marinum]|uniref:glycosyltransferase family 4 protein n=1 Tax=Corynebacterium marinum TaxID=349751 RepID=UPI001E514D51|nr:glycosyltransferase family 4 protein [Corynebacterium marinum]